MYLQTLQRNWEKFGREDPLWAIATVPEKFNNKWEPDEFFATGRRKVALLEKWMDANGLPRSRRLALDFGCGVGRLTQSLASLFERCVGVDIAQSMIDQARRFNRHGAKCTYVLNDFPDLRRFKSGTFDLIYTEHVLQHIHPRVSLGYVREFVRVLAPGGLLAFQAPCKLHRFEFPNTGLKAEVRVSAPFVSMEEGGRAAISVRVKNTGDHVWGKTVEPPLPMRVVVHWCTPDGQVLHPFHCSQTIPGELLPGQEADIDIPLRSPATCGRFLAVIEVVDFNEKPLPDGGCTPVVVEAAIEPSSEARESRAKVGSEADRPVMEMHALPMDVVVRTIEQAGGKVVEARSNSPRNCHTQGWYYVTR